MSRTKKIIKLDKPKKMKAYTAEKNQQKEKFEPAQSKFGKFSTPQDKLEARNANRSLKKSVRQAAKNDLKSFL